MRIILKIILSILVCYFGLGMILYFYFSFVRVDDIYQMEKKVYDRDLECYECFIGERSGVCPQIHLYSSKKSYPSAQESTEATLRCFWSWDNGFNVKIPSKSLLHSFRENWEYSWQGYLFWTFMILTFFQVSLG